jgi:hypothetical protein
VPQHIQRPIQQAPGILLSQQNVRQLQQDLVLDFQLFAAVYVLQSAHHARRRAVNFVRQNGPAHRHPGPVAAEMPQPQVQHEPAVRAGQHRRGRCQERGPVVRMHPVQRLRLLRQQAGRLSSEQPTQLRRKPQLSGQEVEVPQTVARRLECNLQALQLTRCSCVRRAHSPRLPGPFRHLGCNLLA